jgi:hypothetical protein
VGWHPARPVLGERPTGHERVEMEVGLQHLIPGMEDHDGAELAAQVLTAKLEEIEAEIQAVRQAKRQQRTA